MATERLANDNGQLNEIPADEARELFDRMAREQLGMSGAEFIQKWDAGGFGDERDSGRVMHLAMLMPLGR